MTRFGAGSEITGGTFTAVREVTMGENVKISGGTFNFWNDYAKINSSVQITGGTFQNFDPSEFVSLEKHCVKKENDSSMGGYVWSVSPQA